MRYNGIRARASLAVALILTGSSFLMAQQTVGLFLNDEDSFDGYTLFNQINSFHTYLIDNAGKLVQSWQSDSEPAFSVYLLENGHLLRTARFAVGGAPFFGGGSGGRVEEFTWDGERIWDYVYSTNDHRQHHDIEGLPNGNVLLVAWEHKSAAEAIAAGADPLTLPGQLWPDHVVEVEPLGASGGTIVWEWHAWDHLIQDLDPTKDNFGVVADHPELIHINFAAGSTDWLHVNSVDYNPAFDQIILSASRFDEVWVIDHSTTTAEAASHSGGNSGMGGDLLYRWGNPQAYDRGVSGDQKLFGQHDAHWIEPGLPGAGNILVFNNGTNRPDGSYSTVDEIEPPVDLFGVYSLDAASAYGPQDLVWSYVGEPPEDFYSSGISGAQRLPNDDTLICEGTKGTFFETTPAMTIVWEYVNPVTPTGTTTQGDPTPNNNNVFRAYRYAPNYPAFDGKDLTPGDPLEQYTKPLPAPDGRDGTEPLTCMRSLGPDQLRVFWDVQSCPADDYHLIFGDLAGVAGHSLLGGACGIGTSGSYQWAGVPSGDLFFLVLGVDDTGVYESSWGTDSTGAERNGGSPSNLCAVTTKDSGETCP